MIAFLTRLRALVVGAFVASMIVALLGGSAHTPMELLIPVMVGNLMVAGGLLVLLCIARIPALRIPLPEDASYFWFSFLLCLAPSLVGPWLPDLPTFLFAGLVFVVAFPVAQRLPGVPLVWSLVILVVAPLATGFGAAYNHNILVAANKSRSSPQLPEPSETVVDGGMDVILVSIDTLRADAIVGPREPAYDLPFFDGMRSEGRWWDYGYSPSNETLPGHVSMLSGHNAMTNRVRFNLDPVPGPEQMKMIQEYFSDAGYQTAAVISNGVISSGVGFGRGFDVYDDSTVRHFGARYDCIAYLRPRSWFGLLMTDRAAHGFLGRMTFHALSRPPARLKGRSQRERAAVTNEQAMDLFDQLYAHDRPFFFFLHYIDPHHPYGAPEGFDGRMTGDRFEDIPAPVRGNEETKGMIDMEQIYPVQNSFADPDPVRQAQGKRGAAYHHAIYLENVLYLDSQLMEIKERVAASGRPTMWLITADHGEQFGEHGTMLHSEELYKDSIRVPFILVGPGIEPEHADGIPMLSDVAPTLLSAVDLDFMEDMTGHSLVGGYGVPNPYQMASEDDLVMLRDRDLKVIARRVKDGVEAVSFFDLAADPLETRNLHGTHPEEERLMGILREQLKNDQYIAGDIKVSAERAAQLAEMGYGHDLEEAEGD